MNTLMTKEQMTARDKAIEAMAEAIFIVDGGTKHRWPDVWGPARQRYINCATAALNAPNSIVTINPVEPTNETVEAAARVLIECGWAPYPSWLPLAKKALIVAMATSNLTKPLR